MLGTKQPTENDYKDGRTKQSFKDETDINAILKKAQRTGTFSHLNKHEARYGDFSDFDFFEAQLKISAGREIFDDLPVELRMEFNQSPAAFFDYVNDPANKDRLKTLLPDLAEPGRQLISVRPETADDAAARGASDQTTFDPVAAGAHDPEPEEAPTPSDGDSSALLDTELAR